MIIISIQQINLEGYFIFYIYTKLISGDTISKFKESERFCVNKRSIQRDIYELRIFFENQFIDVKSNKSLCMIEQAIVTNW